MAVLVAWTREREDPSPLMPGHLRHDVRRGAEPVEPSGGRIARGGERAVADEPGAKQGRRVHGIVSGRHRQAVALVGHRQLGVAAVAVVAGEAGPVAQVLAPRAAVTALAAGPAEPGNPDRRTGGEPRRSVAGFRDGAHDLVAQYQGELGVGQLAGLHVEIGAAHSAGAHPDQQLPRARDGRLHPSLDQRRAGSLEHHGAHGCKLVVSRGS